MDREYVLTIFVLAIGGLAIALTNLVPRRPSSVRATVERDAWRRLWTPVVVAMLGTAWLWGWWLREPDASEAVPWEYVAVAIIAGGVCARAVIRAISSRLTGARPPAYTCGLIKPRSVIAPTFAEILDEDQLRAVKAHEEAHARHRDPLRLCLGQLCADLQWPSRGAAERFRRWRAALEMVRDDEARAAGANGADLASAVIAALRFAECEGHGVVGLISESRLILARVDRLLSPLDRSSLGTGSSRQLVIGWMAAFVAVAFAGTVWGEAIVRTLTSW